MSSIGTTVTNATGMSTQDFSVAVGETPITVYTTAQLPTPPKYLRLWNVSTGTIWLSRAGTAAVGGPGSYPLGPGLYELFTIPAAIPRNPLSAVATAADCVLTVEAG